MLPGPARCGKATMSKHFVAAVASSRLMAGCAPGWFDAFESVQLTPGGTLALFREVTGAGATPASTTHAVSALHARAARHARSAACNSIPLLAVSPWPRALHAFRSVPAREDFIRPLSAAEIERLRSHIRTIRCSGCGAPVDLARDMVCRYCSAPIEALDPAAIEIAVQRLDNAERKRGEIDVDKLADALLMRYSRKGADDAFALTIESVGFDLIGTGIDVVLSAIDAD